MLKTRIKKILKEGQAGEKVEVCGWIRTKRISKAFAFVVINDGSCMDSLQFVVDAGTPGFDKLPECNTGAAVKVSGELRESPGKGQRIEAGLEDIEILGNADSETYPLQKKGHSLEFLREIGHLRPRTNTFGAVFRVRSVLSQAVHEFFAGRGFLWIHTPILTANDCEGAGEMFTVSNFDLKNPPRDDKGEIDYKQDYFGKHAHLTVSGQLEAEFMAMALGDVYTFGPTFRAENSNTTRHLSEFWMIEPEIAFADLADDVQLAEDFMQHMCKAVLERCEDDLAFLQKLYKTKIDDIKMIAETPFEKITYTEAIEILSKQKKAKFEFPVEWGLELQTEHEKWLTDKVFRKCVAVTDYPKDVKAFYMRMNEDNKTVAAMDVLAPRIGEIIGGSQREERGDMLAARMEAMNVPTEGLEWFMDLRRYGSAKHAGFGLGFERLVQYLTGMANIRDVIPCPRTPQSIEF